MSYELEVTIHDLYIEFTLCEKQNYQVALCN